MPIEAAACLQLHKRHILLARRIQQEGRIAQRLRAAGIHPADELGGGPQAEIRREVIAFHLGAAAQGAVMTAGITGIFLGQQGVEDGTVDGIGFRLRPLLQPGQTSVEAVRRQCFLIGRATHVGLQHLRGIALRQALPVNLVGQLDDGLRQALFLRLRHLLPQLVVTLGVQGHKRPEHRQQHEAAQTSDCFHKASSFKLLIQFRIKGLSDKVYRRARASIPTNTSNGTDEHERGYRCTNPATGLQNLSRIIRVAPICKNKVTK